MKVAIVKNDIGLVPLEEFRDAIDVATAVLNFCNEYAPPFNVANYTGIDATAIDLSKQWSYDFSLSQLIETTHKIGVVVPVNLDTFKDEMISLLVEKRSNRFNSHKILFEYPASSGKMFSCSTESQDNWSKIETLFSKGLATYPFKVFTFDERDNYNIIDDADLTQILGTIAVKVITERGLFDTYVVAVLLAVDEPAAILAAQPYLDL